MMYEIPKIGFVNLNHVHMVTHPKKVKDDWQGVKWTFEIHIGIKTIEVKITCGNYSDSDYKDPALAELGIKEAHKGLIDALYALNVQKVVDSVTNETNFVKRHPNYPDIEEEFKDDSEDWGMRMSD